MPLIHDSILFHNVEKLEPIANAPGLLLQRFPSALRNRLGFKSHSRGRFFATRSSGSELRFVTEAKFLRVTLTAVENGAHVIVYRGDYTHSRHFLPAGTLCTLFLEEPEFFNRVDPLSLKPKRFSAEVWRITFNQDAQILYHAIDVFGHSIRPPAPDEQPKRRWLAYGSSITFGANAFLPSNTYIEQAARHLAVDVLCKGLPGSALCELAMAQYIAAQPDWHFATLELGVNLTELATPAEFEQKVSEFLSCLCHCERPRPLFVVDIFPNRADRFAKRSAQSSINTPVFREILQQVVLTMDSPHLHTFDARTILPDFCGLTSDLLHPSDDGHIAMGKNLADLIAMNSQHLQAG